MLSTGDTVNGEAVCSGCCADSRAEDYPFCVARDRIAWIPLSDVLRTIANDDLDKEERARVAQCPLSMIMTSSMLCTSPLTSRFPPSSL